MATPKLYVLGDDQVKAALTAVLPRIRKTVLRKAMRQGARMAAKKAKANAKIAFTSRSGLLYSAIRGDVTGGKKGKDPIARVRIHPSVAGIYQGRKRRPSAYAHLVEYGSMKRNVRARSFMRGVFDDPDIFAAIKRTAQIEFKKEMKKKVVGV
jgi:hypothetical protein